MNRCRTQKLALFQNDMASEKNKEKLVKATVAGIGGLSLIAMGIFFIIFMQGDNPRISVRFSGYKSETNETRTATFVLKNTGNVPIIRKWDCFIYWALKDGIKTNRLVRLMPETTVGPGDSETVMLPYPNDAVSYYASFGYEKKPSVIGPVVEKIDRLFHPKVVTYASYALSETITSNSMPSSRALGE